MSVSQWEELACGVDADLQKSRQECSYVVMSTWQSACPPWPRGSMPADRLTNAALAADSSSAAHKSVARASLVFIEEVL